MVPAVRRARSLRLPDMHSHGRRQGRTTDTASDLAAAGADLADRQLAYRQPSAGATWVRMLSMTWAL